MSQDTRETGEKFSVLSTVQNIGNAQAAATTVRYLRSTDSEITTSDTLEGTDDVRALGPLQGYGASFRHTAPSTAGTYYYGACVDAVSGESDTTDNCSVSVQMNIVDPPPRPDLEVGPPTVSDANPEAGAAFTLSASVSNAGDGQSAATTLQYYRSADATISTSDTLEGTDSIGTLPAGGTSAQSITLTAPSTGTYYYGACVDAVSNESDTTDNCSTSVRVDVAARTPRPDLEVGTPNVSDASPEAGSTFTLSATVTNAGDGESASATLRYYRSADATVSSSDTLVGADSIGALAVGATSAESVTLSAPSTVGTYYYGACVESVSQESDTSNNCSAAVRVGVVARTPRPDLEVGTPNVSDASPETGATFTLSATVSNAGDDQSAATTLRYYQSADATISTSDTQLGTDSIGTLAAGGTSAQSIDVTAPSTTGTYHYGACVDAVLDESDTTDNCSASVRVDTEDPSDDGAAAVNSMTVEDTSLWQNADGGFFVFHDNRADTTNDPVPDAWNIYGQPLEFDAVRVYADGSVQIDIDTVDDSDAIVSSALDATVRYLIQLSSGGNAVTVVHEGDIGDVKIVPDNAEAVSAFHDLLTAGTPGTAVVSDGEPPDDESPATNAMAVEDTSLWENDSSGIFVFHDNRSDSVNDPVPDAWNIFGQPLEFDAATVYDEGSIKIDIDTEDDSDATVSSALDATVRYAIQLSSGGHSVTVVHEGDIGDVKFLPDNAEAVSAFYDLLTAGTAGTAVVSDDPALAATPNP